jgi:ribosomal-protein-alanine N-acetyltransferase
MISLKSERIILREINANDLEFMHHLHSLPEVDQYNTLGIPENNMASEKLLNNWIVAFSELPRKRYVFIMENSNDLPIGLLGLNIGKPGYANGEIWYKLAPAFWAKGYATEAVKTILDFGFNQLQLHRIEAGCAVENIGSIKVLEKAGFTKEGRTRKLLPIRGEWHDNFGFAILEEDWQKTNPY